MKTGSVLLGDWCSKTVKEHAVSIFYLLLGLALLNVDWQKTSILATLLVIFCASLLADLVSGLWHLYVDYYPLNYKLGYDKLLFYEDDRKSPAFMELSGMIVPKGTVMDRQAYFFKLHHKWPRKDKTINNLFLDTAYAAYAALIYSCILLTLAGVEFFHDVAILNIPFNYPEIIIFWLFVAVFAANVEYIHQSVHFPEDYPIGGKVIGFLQKIGMIYKTEVHERHHRGDGGGFCFVTGHANFIVNKLISLLLKKGVITQERWHGGL